MSATLFVLIGLASCVLAGVSAVSFRVGRSRGFGEVFHIRMEAAQARRRMHDLTRQAFTAMSEAAEDRQRNSHGES